MEQHNELIFIIVTCFTVIMYSLFLILYCSEASSSVCLGNEDISINNANNAQIYDNKTDLLRENHDKADNIDMRIKSFDLSKEDYLGYLNEDETERIRDLIVGNTFYVNNTMLFNFFPDYSFSGFFDSSSINVADYSYEVAASYSGFLLNIYNDEHTKAVSYDLSVDDKDNLYLYHKNADVWMLLRKV